MSQQEKPATKKIFVFLRIGVVLAGVLVGVVWVCREQRYVKLGEIFARMGLGFFAGVLAVFIFSQVVVSLRWWLLLRTQSVHISIRSAIRLFFLGLFYNNFMPGAVGGDLIRAWYVTRHTEHRFAAALSVLVDRIIGFTSSMIMAFFAYFVLLRGEMTLGGGEKGRAETAKSANWQELVVWGLIILGVGAVIIIILPAGRRLTARVLGLLYGHGLRVAKKCWKAAVIYCRNPFTLLAAYGLTFLLQGLVITSFWLVGRHIGIEASAKYYFVFFPLTWGLGAIPVSVGGAVVVEGGLVSLFTVIAGVEPEQALAIALCQRVVWMLASLPGGFVHLAGGHLPKEIAIDYGEEAN